MTLRELAVASSAKTLETLRGDIVRRYEELSPRLQQVAKYVLENPNDMALQTLAVIAERCEVQPSTIVRFAKTFGYEGASDMQELFKDEMLTQAPSPSYAERIRQFSRRAGAAGALAPQDVMHEFADSNILALEHLKSSVRKADLERAVEMIAGASAVYIVGLRRSFPVASYLAYALRHVDKRAYLLDGVAGMLAEQSTMLTSKDLLIAISFQPYAAETVEIVGSTREQKARIIAITDSRLSPIAAASDLVFEIKDAEVRQFRSLTASLCLAQSLVISYAFDMEKRGRVR
ncbi:sigma factor regulator FecR [Steroidobacter agaridevorans]|uniref:Sigma factor regulator FecR n=1 Tax=Steroidobacter agaridevorans TaxID=2695856 RepID=A0A829YHY1_9GAMM|nr:MurR/RpiR family transcriptional regulator [Steroidobacter agaridevorans]GFE82850.1 sigma factor regulator FecR [Steroidobacter agaridevorans]GFE85935.1 sigma factor regulator FecR [Steroidobacter agaridevorans]